ncbi:hypothetical protein Fmac_001830 [Flemingia macrophylla]|uniref:Uncharacterized protein n=1 Tax=Flemingia macrophylla TaxID=520843 RepID=A0ABD1NI85_9FABA
MTDFLRLSRKNRDRAYEQKRNFIWSIAPTSLLALRHDSSLSTHCLFPLFLGIDSAIYVDEVIRTTVYLDVRVCISILHPRGDDPNGYDLASECWAPVHTVISRIVPLQIFVQIAAIVHNVVASDSPSITCGDLKREALAIEVGIVLPILPPVS